ncbi:SMI1/KNR4 family protein [Flavobacterium sp. CLA17]|uniref:SMI1/KNR4 family protein n=1 Tax=Flavobacterium sp. CLA17 TaxID=2724135 RepID=UPI0014910193|nr:SMI1/KNR4 family protein [Flavobacterium sp. CLA17]QSB25654.1 SMI1/KNR4 family protein [Flavobacterium sp. CLA17]
MNYLEVLKKGLYKFEDLGVQKSENGAILIGKAPHIAQLAWLNKIYPILGDKDIVLLGKELKREIPKDYKLFLTNFSNGLNIFVSTFSLHGLRKELGRSVEASRQPFSIFTPNLQERPKNAKDNYFFIGGYNWDGSKLYLDSVTNKVHYCAEWDATSLYEWNSFEEMIISEIKRITSLFDEKGVVLDKNKHTTPIEIL